MSCVTLKTQLHLSSSIFDLSESIVSAFVVISLPPNVKLSVTVPKKKTKCAVMSTSSCTGTDTPDSFYVSITVNLDDSHVNVSVPDHFDM